MIKLMVFLGNPGRNYEKTRHNAGFLLCDYRYPSMSWQTKFHSLYGQDGQTKVMKPMTYMNLSGTAVSECTTFFKIRPEEVLVIHDDLELPFGKGRLQKGGGLQGHNGLRSIKERLGSDQFWRLRIGIGRPVHGDVRLYVTSNFPENDLISLNQLFTRLDRLLDHPDTEAEASL